MTIWPVPLIAAATAAALAVAAAVAWKAAPEPGLPSAGLAATLSQAEVCGDLGALASLAASDPGAPLPHALATPFDPTTGIATLTVAGPDATVPRAGFNARVVLKLADRKTGLPLTGQRVAGWMDLRRNGQVAAEIPCRARAEMFSRGRVTARPDVDLNASRLMILNRDGTVVLVNPQIDFTITQMENVIPLPGVPADWAMARDGRTVFVSLPVFGAVAVIDAVEFTLTGLIEFPKGSMPTTLLPRADGSVAVYLSAQGAIVIAHPDGSGHSEPFPVGTGPVAIAAGSAGRLFVLTAGGALTAIDPARGSGLTVASLPPGEPALAVAADDDAVLAVTDTSDRIRVFHEGTLAASGDIAVQPGIFTLAKVPDAAQVMALNAVTDRMLLIDAKAARTVAEADVAAAPVEVAFSHEYAYVRGLEGDVFTIFGLAEMASGRLTPMNVQSSSGPVRRHEALARARMIAPFGHGALIANEDEAQAYYFMEGMNTAMGTVKTYGTQVQGVMTLDHSFRETAPGTYETSAVLPFAGVYDVPLVIGLNDATVCVMASAGPAPDTGALVADHDLTVTAELPEAMSARAEQRFVFSVADKDGAPVAGLGDLRLMAFTPSGGWAARRWATDLGAGRYEAAWVFPDAGRYGISFEARSRHLGFADLRPVYFKIGRADGRTISD